MSDEPTISTHVLETGSGTPAAGVGVTLERLESGSYARVGSGTTDQDGRIRRLLEGKLTSGEYRLEFAAQTEFFVRLSVTFRVVDTSRSYHVPLLLAPYSATTYRGS